MSRSEFWRKESLRTHMFFCYLLDPESRLSPRFHRLSCCLEPAKVNLRSESGRVENAG